MQLSTPTEPVSIQMSYSALPKQAEFHSSNAKYRFFGGGFGNGKTSAGVRRHSLSVSSIRALSGSSCVRLALSFSLPRCLRFGRVEVVTLTAETSLVVLKSSSSPTTRPSPRSSSSTGLMIYYWPLDDAKKLTNINLGWFLIDQAEEIGEEIFLMLKGRLRRKRSPRKGMILFNPNGHDWIWKYCVHLKMPDHELIHAKTTDNPNLPADYIEQLMNYPDSWRKRFMDGSFDVFSGQIWPEFDPDVHVVTPRPLEHWWEIVEGIDHGRRNPTAVLWAAFDDKGNCFIVDEHYQAGQRVGSPRPEDPRQPRSCWASRRTTP
jgi:hypothetical protein